MNWLESILPEFNVTDLEFLEEILDSLPKGKRVIGIVQWAKEKRFLPAEIARRAGLFDWSLVPHLIEPAECLSPNNPTQHVIVCKGVQIGATTGLIENLIGFTVEHDPCGLMYAREEKEAAEIAMELRVDRMLDLAGLSHLLFAASKTGGPRGGNRKLLKQFAGGFINAIGVNNANKGRSLPVRKLLRDEVDAWKALTVGAEKSDPMVITEARTDAFPDNKKILDISTPLETNTSRIWKLLNESDFCKRFVPCPFCGEFQELVWLDKELDTGFMYKTTKNLSLVPGSVHYKCRYCKKKITGDYRHGMMNAGKYVATNESPKRTLTRGFHIPSWYGLFKTWDEVVLKWIDTLSGHDKRERLKEFHNLRMALPFEDVELSPNPEMMKGKNRNYLPGVVPNELAIKDGHGPILILTCAVDVHKNKSNSNGRLDVEVLGHCRDGATYSVLWDRLEGDTEAYWFREFSAAYQADQEALENNTWYRLQNNIMSEQYVSDDGKNVYPIRLTGVDMGYEGYLVQTFCRQFSSGVVPVHGMNKINMIAEYIKEKDGDHGKFWYLAVDKYKDRLADYMALKWIGHPLLQPPGFLNYPHGPQYNKEYFDMYGAENKTPIHDERTGRYKGSAWKQKYSKAPNHAWDCRVYNMAVLDIFVLMVCQAGNIEGLDYKYVFDAFEDSIAL